MNNVMGMMTAAMVLEMLMVMETYGGYGDGEGLFGDSGGGGGGGMYGNGMALGIKDIQYTQKTDVNSVIKVSARDVKDASKNAGLYL